VNRYAGHLSKRAFIVQIFDGWSVPVIADCRTIPRHEASAAVEFVFQVLEGAGALIGHVNQYRLEREAGRALVYIRFHLPDRSLWTAIVKTTKTQPRTECVAV